MDDSPVQTAVCVIGHPIAGNPAQFCISRLLASMQIDWQCLSFDVSPESLETAIAGIDVLHFGGALIAPPHQSAVAQMIRQRRQPPPTTTAPLPSPALLSPALPSSPLPAPSPAPSLTPPSTQDSPATTGSEPLPPNLPTSTAVTPIAPTPAEVLWCDALARNAEGHWETCNLVGETLLELIRQHEQRIGGPLATCLFLGDAVAFDSIMPPFLTCLPEKTFRLGMSGLEPVGGDLTDTREPLTVAEVPASPAVPADVPPDIDPDEPANPPAAPTDPLLSPLLVLRPQDAIAPNKKSSAKPPAQRAWVAAILEDLHPQSLVVDLAPLDAPWPVLRSQEDASMARISPLDLEVGRIAAALQRWTGKNVDRSALVEAIEEYFEV